MKKSILIMGIIGFLSACFAGKAKQVQTQEPAAASIYDITIKTLDGKSDIRFSDYKGKYIIVLNTASECGYTYQYKDFQEFYSNYKDSNIVVIGCPCNQFGSQEPGTPVEIGSFCQKNYGVTFPLTEKIDVKGETQHPLYKWLTTKELNGAGDFEVKWNFNKFIISPEGKLLWYFGSGTKPFDKEFMNALGLQPKA